MSAIGYGQAQVEAGSAPPLIRRSGHAGLGTLMLAIATIWLGAAINGVLRGHPAILPGLGGSGALWAGAVGAGLAALSLHWIVRRQTVLIEDDVLLVTERSLFGSRSWREPLSNYREIRGRHEQQPHRDGWRRWYVVQLWHPVPTKRVELARSRDPAAIEAGVRAYVRRVGLPLVWQQQESAISVAEAQDEITAAAAPGQALSRRTLRRPQPSQGCRGAGRVRRPSNDSAAAPTAPPDRHAEVELDRRVR